MYPSPHRRRIPQNTNSNQPLCITATASSTLETTCIPPQLDILDDLLQVCVPVAKTSVPCKHLPKASALTEAEEAFGLDESVGHTVDQLLAAVPASQQELQAALTARNALRLGDRWRAVSDACLDSLLKVGFLTVDRDSSGTT